MEYNKEYNIAYDYPNKDLLFALIERIEADKDRNISITFKYDILDTHTFKYYDNRIHNPFGRNGKIKQ